MRDGAHETCRTRRLRSGDAQTGVVSALPHKTPVATLQPLDGVVQQPGGRAHDIYGWPIDGALQEAEKLGEVQQELLTNGIRFGRLVPARLSYRFDFGRLNRAVQDLALRGMARRTERGWELTGRGMVLREALLRRVASSR